MRVVADENIPFAREAFAEFGDVVTLPGRKMTTADLAEADVLLVRSITKVDSTLLEGSTVKFVATATIGVDHIDEIYLRGRGIGFASAPGCNANSVAEYITAALLHLADKHALSLEGMSIGVVGVGNVGKKVAAKAHALGMRVVLNDPPLAEATCEPAYRSIAEIQACDVVTFHVPLEKSGTYPTVHLCDAAFLAGMKPGGILINTARGPVLDNAALYDALTRKHVRATVLDVWEGEPNTHEALLAEVDIASPHIAGYSFDGKVNGTRQIYEAACVHFGRKTTWDPTPLLPTPECPEISLGNGDTVAGCVRKVYDILADDARMRETLALPKAERAAYFDRLRKEYPRRREFQNTVCRGGDEATRRQLGALGFRVE